jgi:hypothetical protein
LFSLLRPGTYGLERYVVKRYVEQVLSQSDRWRQLSPYFSIIPSPIRTYTLTSYEVELMKRILDYHLNDTVRVRITVATDQLIEYDDLLDFIRRVQDLSCSNSNAANNIRPMPGKKSAIPSIPSIHSSYILPPSAKSMMPPLPPPKISPVKPILAKPAPPPIITISPTQSNKIQSSTTAMNGHNRSQISIDSSSRLSSTVQIKPDLISPPGIFLISIF